MANNKNESSWGPLAKRLNLDGWQNIITGLGIKARDKVSNTTAIYQGSQNQMHFENIYASDEIAEAVVDTLPEDMIREGFSLTHDLEDAELSTNFIAYLDNLGFNSVVLEALIWARLYGGAITVMGINDGQAADQPVDIEKIKSIDYFVNFHRFEVSPGEIQKTLEKKGKNFRMPRTYRLQSSALNTGELEIHHSRVIRWDGSRLPQNLFEGNNYWHDSVLNKLERALQAYNTAHDSAALAISELYIPIFKLKNLTQLISEGKDDLITKRLELVNMVKSVNRAVVIQDDEDFHREVPNLTALPQLLDKTDQRLVSASRMPHTILLGEGPKGGLGSDGKSEKQDWYSRVSREQQKTLNPKYNTVFKYIFNSDDGPSKGVEPKMWGYDHKPLHKESDGEVLGRKKTQADIDKIYLDSQVVDPNEVAVSRWGAGEYSHDMQISMEDREEDEAIKDDEVAKIRQELEEIKKKKEGEE